jgi:predicted homoserine dehydrogenase-like protein
VDVVAMAKTDLTAGTTLDGLGGYHTYGVAENSDITHTQGLLPMGLAEGCRLKRDLKKDEVLTYADVEVPSGRVSDALRTEQNQKFWGSQPAGHPEWAASGKSVLPSRVPPAQNVAHAGR